MLPPARVDVILARRARRAVVFRRGPSKWTLVLRWDTDTDTFTAGDWFHGRIYTRRCDITPDGRHLVYFAAKFWSQRQTQLNFGHSWTAISEMPRLEPLGLWAKEDCWFGGGLFSTDDAVELNERPDTLVDAAGHHRFQVSWNDRAGGEDEPIYRRRLERDGWETVQEIEAEHQGGNRGFETTQVQLRRKRGLRLPTGGAPVHRHLEATWAIERYESIRTWSVLDEHGTRHPIDGATWADWDQRGRLVVARDGSIFAGRFTDGTLTFDQLIDLDAIVPPGSGPSPPPSGPR